MKENKYDDNIFFFFFCKMSRSQQGLAGSGEWETFWILLPIFTRMGHMTSGLGGLAPFFRRFLPLLNGYTPFFQPFFGHFWPPVNGFLPSPSGWDCSDFTITPVIKTIRQCSKRPVQPLNSICLVILPFSWASVLHRNIKIPRLGTTSSSAWLRPR